MCIICSFNFCPIAMLFHLLMLYTSHTNTSVCEVYTWTKVCSITAAVLANKKTFMLKLRLHG